MLNGKFFTGLPERMMNRSSGPDRQRSNLFWPDEEKLPPATENKKVLKGKGRATQNNYATVDQLNQDPEESAIVPKELFQKQLTSKIEFYDMVDTPKTGKRGTYKAEKINTNKLANNDQPINNKKQEAFQSKIEFYDYADDQPPRTPPKMDRNSKVEVEKYSQNSPKLYEKRITFIDNKTNNNVQKPRSILKNTDITVEKPKNIKKKNLSKSVENLSRSKSAPNIPKDNYEVIENDVRNIPLNNEISDNVEIDRHAVQHKVKEHRIEIQQEVHQNGYDRRVPEERFEPVMMTPPSRRQTREVREEYEDRNDNGFVSSNHSRSTRVYNEPDFEPDSFSTPRRIIRPSPPQRRDIYDEEQSRNNKTYRFW